jgi:hypothetical protein
VNDWQKLSALAWWYREFAERRVNPTISERLGTAEDWKPKRQGSSGPCREP